MSVSNKSQVFSADFLVAVSVFLLVVVVIYVYWTYISSNIAETRKRNYMIDAAQFASRTWFREGMPRYWNSSNVIDLGLESDNRFNQTKMSSLEEIGYEKVKKMVGVSGYGLFFNVYDANNTFFSFGEFPSNAKNVVKVKRMGILNNTMVFVDTIVWE